jgi:hypothetical protein
MELPRFKADWAKIPTTWVTTNSERNTNPLRFTSPLINDSRVMAIWAKVLMISSTEYWMTTRTNE